MSSSFSKEQCLSRVCPTPPRPRSSQKPVQRKTRISMHGGLLEGCPGFSSDDPQEILNLVVGFFSKWNRADSGKRFMKVKS
mmetsp:Transcript_13286/g.28394  ORF Transcript_13286/g.28394 Transcript_13286/m.28394 type:complete len:81 (+) Transcript_13286:87-329(+)